MQNQILAMALLAIGAGVLQAAPDVGGHLTLTALETEPKGAREAIDADDLAGLQAAVTKEPENRTARFALVRGLQRAGMLDEAIVAAKAWRATDAYNLVVVRLLGDLYSEQGNLVAAKRAYSAVVELLPKDASAQRALASVLKQSGDLAGAYDRLVFAATQDAKDRRLAFEIADVAARRGMAEEARTRFETIIADKETADAVRYPAKQRLAQIYQQLARAGDASMATKIDALGLVGGTQNDIKVYLTWDTDASDVDLWVTTPGKDKIFYSNRKGKHGEALYDDVTTGYGPESFTAASAAAGDYVVQVDYFRRGRGNFSEARGEVTVILDEGKPTEQKHVLPYRLFEEKQVVTVAKIHVEGT